MSTRYLRLCAAFDGVSRGLVSTHLSSCQHLSFHTPSINPADGSAGACPDERGVDWTSTRRQEEPPGTLVLRSRVQEERF